MRLLLLHGMLGAGASWEGLRARLDAEVHAPTLFGHGADPAPVPTDFDEAADRLDEMIVDCFGDAPYTLCGYSFGARLGLALLARHPARIERAIFVSLHPGLADAGEREARREDDARWAALAEREGVRALVDAWEARPIFATQRAVPDVRFAAQRATRLAHTPDGVAAAFRRLGLGAMPDLHAHLRDPRVALVAGALDEKFVTIARAHAPTPHVLAGCGHNPILEAPDALAAIITAERSTP